MNLHAFGMLISCSTVVQSRTIETTSMPLPDGFVLSDGWVIFSGTYGASLSPQAVPRLATRTQGATLSFPLTNSSAFYIVGHVNDDHGAFTVNVTPSSSELTPQVGHYNAFSDWIGLYLIKYLSSGMNRSQTYNVEIRNDSPNLYFDMSEIVVFDTLPCVGFLMWYISKTDPNDTAHPHRQEVTLVEGPRIPQVMEPLQE